MDVYLQFKMCASLRAFTVECVRLVLDLHGPVHIPVRLRTEDAFPGPQLSLPQKLQISWKRHTKNILEHELVGWFEIRCRNWHRYSSAGLKSPKVSNTAC